MDNRPIGVFDSGLGGLTGVRAVSYTHLRLGSFAIALVSAAFIALPSMKPAFTTNFLDLSPSWYLHRMRACLLYTSRCV